MIASELTGPLAALTAGVVTSLHCVGMCGPLVCSICVKDSRNEACGNALLWYHFTRVISYAACGALAGLFGKALAPVFEGMTSHVMVWGFALVFAVVALGLDQRVRLPGFITRRFAAVVNGLRKWSGPSRGGVLGAATPLLPCGPLYLVIGVAAVSATIPGGALLLASFAVGTIPLALAAQFQWFRLQRRWSPLAMANSRRVLAAVSAIILILRATSGTGLDAPMCPFCK